ncbi:MULTISPECIES: secondary thiamine-phosphate synthase enzyme YjbQ [unclassified Polaribacter]|uniref:secondary thiamine-phosphate synthase enzyme YjbQ n=1 Tax=unclassified Polaribacter TaxID=196858 RepID=UPI0011BD7C48|nr:MULTISPECIES: secondary thiamine-phosphate synthase enzyme YjbQ [unclassified Polaribacter]TXD54026.1 YjbQ family protein [Polaribacter sp. IC063]TXD62542.1 YjbQ family protein [Polaribacter sp. IC066]
MIFEQKEIQLNPFNRGFHLITDLILNEFPEVEKIEKGFLKVFIKHTSASLAINENADTTVRLDFESHFNIMVPENASYYQHIYEGSDDMPAHIKASLLGSFIEVPITDGKLNMGIWQGIYLCEHRNLGGSRKLILSAFGV